MNPFEAFLPPVAATAFVVDPRVPLTRTEPETGNTVDVLCWPMFGMLMFHPLRMEQLKQAIARQQLARQQLELGRWADDGGRVP